MNSTIPPAQAAAPGLQILRLPVDKPQPAVAFLRARSGGVMDLIAHFWERLSHTPPLQRRDLHLVTAVSPPEDIVNVDINTFELDIRRVRGAMLYVPKAHRADVLALDRPTAEAFATYIRYQGMWGAALRAATGNRRTGAGSGGLLPEASGWRDSRTHDVVAPDPDPDAANATHPEPAVPLQLADLSNGELGGPVLLSNGSGEILDNPFGATGDGAGVGGTGSGNAGGGQNGGVPIDFLTGDSAGIAWMTPLLLPLVRKRVPARQLINVVMQLPGEVPTSLDPRVRLARDEDIPVLNRWRRLYREERGIHFDADMDSWIDRQRVFVCESDGSVVAVAKFDLELQNLIEIGGVYTFAEYRNRGFGWAIVGDMATRIRQAGKIPTLQVDVENTPALRLYEKARWREMGRLARVWLTG